MLSFDGGWSPTTASQDTSGNIAIAEGPEQIALYAHALKNCNATH
ncbi:hypothetical protein [Streptomyces iconiensis]|uniref:Uncharacterized protein n=1 Tax=Streptomyces iconiensis TaxID=1384038 RepID=A0ABT6ZNT8_9ACTN|nr:hypothetical protein [Streptomyces iconiensis]MDJ1130479.1 hypothetical protein [Streptomyces iconiensis]